MIRVLLVNDNPQALGLLPTIFRDHGLVVEFATDGAEALGCARLNPPDVMLVDFGRGGLDSFLLCCELKRDDALRVIPVIITAELDGDHRDEALALRLGADRFLCKPIEPVQLVSVIRELAAQGNDLGAKACSGMVVNSLRRREQPDGRHDGAGHISPTQLEELNHRLQLELAERRRAELALAEELRRKDDFLAMLAHELRNPLAPIRASLHTLKFAGYLTPIQERQRALVDRQVGRIGRMLDDLLDVSRIGRGVIPLQKEKLDLREVIDHTLELSASALHEHSHLLHFTRPDRPFMVQADPMRLEQVLYNLLQNAILYTSPGGHIWIELEGGRAGMDGDWAVIRVRDTGMGMPPDLLARVFDLFSQATHHTADRAVGRLGIGLTLVRRLVELHGGQVAAHSPGLGQGSTFTVTLPLLPAPAQPAAERPPVASADSEQTRPPGPFRRKVLVVDDIRDTAESLAELVEAWDHEVALAYDGRQALEVARLFQPDVLLLDIGLPGLSGYEVARAARQEMEMTSSLIIAVTGYGSDEDRQKALDAGFDYHFTKPVDLNVLREILHKPHELQMASM